MATVTFKQGSGYNGTIDTTIRQAIPDSAIGSATTLQVDGGSGTQIQTLLAFTNIFGSGLGQIPIGATITSATLTLNTTDASGSGISVSRMLMNWSEQSTWNSLGNGVQLNGTEARATPDLTIARADLGSQTFDVTTSLQAWLSGATTAAEANAANDGWVFSALGTNLWKLKSSESGSAPVLSVTYTVSGQSDPAQLSLGGSISKAEGTSSTSTPFVFTVNRSGDASGAASVNYSVTGSGTNPANAGDFAGSVFPSGTINFAAGELSKTITVNVAADSTNEANEAFKVTLSGASGAQINGATATGTIQNDDGTSGGGGETVLGVRITNGSSFGTGTGNNRFGSTDPTDIAYDAATKTFFVCDSEVDESPFFASNNLFKLNSGADFIQGFSLRNFTSEPTGVVIGADQNTGAKRLFISDDNLKMIFVVDPANPGTALRSFSTTSFNVSDPEDLTINPNNGNLFVLSEKSHEIVEITQAGQLVSRVTVPSTFTTLEGFVYDAQNNQFFVCAGFSTKIFIVSRAGAITGSIDVLANYPNANGARVFPKGLELAPASDGSGHLSLWVTDYGRDQVADGRIFEIILNRPAQQSATLASSAGAIETFETQASPTMVDAPIISDPVEVQPISDPVMEPMRFHDLVSSSTDWLL